MVEQLKTVLTPIALQSKVQRWNNSSREVAICLPCLLVGERKWPKRLSRITLGISRETNGRHCLLLGSLTFCSHRIPEAGTYSPLSRTCVNKYKPLKRLENTRYVYLFLLHEHLHAAPFFLSYHPSSSPLLLFIILYVLLELNVIIFFNLLFQLWVHENW